LYGIEMVKGRVLLSREQTIGKVEPRQRDRAKQPPIPTAFELNGGERGRLNLPRRADVIA
jgi:hypothetical protein